MKRGVVAVLVYLFSVVHQILNAPRMFHMKALAVVHVYFCEGCQKEMAAKRKVKRVVKSNHN